MGLKGAWRCGWPKLGGRTARLVAVVSVLSGLSGCIMSDTWLFSRQELVQPLRVGRYDVEKFQDGTWKPDGKPFVIALKDGIYQPVSEKPDEPSFAAFRLSPRFSVLYVIGPGEKGIYMLMEPKDGAYLIYIPECSEFKRSAAAEAFPPDRVKDNYECTYTSREKLIGGLVTYGDTAAPSFRWKYSGAAPSTTPPPAPRIAEATAAPTSPATLDTADPIKFFSLTVCNKSSNANWLALSHAHFYERDKWSLRGWWKLQPAACTTQKVPRGYFYVFAKAADGTLWEGTDRQLCVTDQQTDRVVFQGEQCIPGEKSRGFRRLFNKDDAFTYNFGD